MRAGRYAELQLPVVEALHRYEIGLAELPARTVRRCGTEWTFARIGEITSGADPIHVDPEEDVIRAAGDLSDPGERPLRSAAAHRARRQLSKADLVDEALR